MRYAVISKGLTLSQLQDEVVRSGGRNLRVAIASKQVFCDLDDAGLARIKVIPGLAVKTIVNVKAEQLLTPPGGWLQEGVTALQPVYAASQGSISSGWYQLRESFTPPVTGVGLTTAILDSGIRSSHRTLRDKVLYDMNFTSSPDLDDHFDHGTGVAFLVSGGRHVPGEEAGVAPGGKLINMKVLGDEGVGTSEDAIMALDEIYSITKDQQDRGLIRTDPLAINGVNISFGTGDDGDPDNPLRLACRALIDDFTMHITAAAGNSGPNPQTIMVPAVEEHVWAIGVATFSPLAVWQYSSRGPSLEGLIKPDAVGFGVDMLVASAASDDAFVAKSGTSFSTPLASGAGGLLWEVLRRMFSEDYVPDRAAFEQLMPLICYKPPEAPAEKDNAYGFGLPVGTKFLGMVQQMTGAGTGVLTTALPVMAMAMMMGVVVKGIK